MWDYLLCLPKNSYSSMLDGDTATPTESSMKDKGSKNSLNFFSECPGWLVGLFSGHLTPN